MTRLVELLLFDERLNKAVLRIQTYYRMKRDRIKFMQYMRKRIESKTAIVKAWKSYKFVKLKKALET